MEGLHAAVGAFRPDLVVHQLTDLPDDPTRIEEFLPAHARIRREGTGYLLGAARAAGVARFLAQSIAWRLSGESQAAVEELEGLVLGAGGVVLRYGQFYGPGTYYEADPPAPPRIHVGEAARRTVEALDAAGGTIVTVVEELPAAS